VYDLTHTYCRHYFRYTLQFLRAEGILDEQLQPNDLAGLIAHIFWTEPSNFAVVHLLRTGILDQICARPNAAEDVILVLSHLFLPLGMPASEARFALANRDKTGPSVVVLPPLPAHVTHALSDYNSRALDLLQHYCRWGERCCGSPLPLACGASLVHIASDPFGFGTLGELIVWDSSVLQRGGHTRALR
jgi:hypothetical protein